MTIALTILLIVFVVQSLVKFAVWFTVPYPTRINRIASYYRRGGRVIAVYDTVSLAIMAVLTVLLLLTEMQSLSFVTGLIVGMLTIQIFVHRFNKPLPGNRAPAPSAPPRELLSYAIQDSPGLAWRELVFMTVLFGWALYELIGLLA